MKLLKCYVENFGMFSGYSYEFRDGINCIYSSNSTGKTTLSVFISAMLFGFSETKKQSLDENERKKYLPWQGGTYGGSLTLEAGGKIYTVERTFGQREQDDTYTLRDSETGSVSDDFSENIGEELFGIDRDGFLRTVFLSEKNLPVKNENKTISAKLGNLVGVEGDMTGLDEAIALLDEKRKFYYKKSGVCEINNVKARITEKKLEYDRLTNIKERALENERRLSEKRENKRRLEARKSELSAVVIENAKKKEREVHVERYIEVKNKISLDTCRYNEIEAILGDVIPTPTMIEEAKFSIAEGERIIKSCADDIGGGYNELYERYGSIDSEVITSAGRAATDLKSTNDKIAYIKSGSDQASIRMAAMFPNGAPTEDDINGYLKSRKNGGFSKKMSMFVGILATLGGIALGLFVNPVLYSLSLIGLIFCLLSFRSWGVSSTEDRSRLLDKLGLTRATLTKDEIEGIRRRIAIYDEIRESRESELSSLVKRKDELSALLGELSSKLGITPSGDPLEDINTIRDEYTRYYTMTVAAKQKADGQKERLATAETMIKRGRDFISRFPLKTDDPFSELSSLVSEYSYLKIAIGSAKVECEGLEKRFGISEAVINESREDIDNRAEDELRECEDQLKGALHEYAVLESEYERQMRECEVMDAISSEIEALVTTLGEYQATLRVIQSTIAYLTEACDNMTSRYIGKTRDGFLRYVSKIDEDGGSYAVDTDFSVTKNEHGSARALESYSRGTKDFYSLAVRLALIDALYENESPFVILDDPFIAFDDERIKKGKDLIRLLPEERQILYFTCSKSRVI